MRSHRSEFASFLARVACRLAVALAAVGVALLGTTASAATPSTLVVTDHGPVQGKVVGQMREFLGIPYAAPPVGALRWRPPQAPASWSQPLDATQFANHCPQPFSPFGTPSTTEDCLYLNVFTPDTQSFFPRPVMVWFHGGALYLGESDDYDPAKLVTQGNVIVVTINYRLGALGFLAHPALSAESPDHVSGNYGFMDQQAALRWVRRNIARFGGNPHDVTIFGQSAGGLSVHFQLASPAAHGLFQRAIAESGAYNLFAEPTLAQAEAQGTAFAANVGCSDQTAACLRSVPVGQILVAQGMGLGGGLGFSPTVDGKLLPQEIGDAFRSGQFNHVPVIEGSTHDEYRLFVGLFFDLLGGGPVTPTTYPFAAAATVGPNLAAQALPHYPLSDYASPDLALSALATDAMFACPARQASRLLSRHVPTYEYEFNDENAPQLFLPPVSFPYGAYHASELQYLFGVRTLVPAAPLTPDQQQLSDTMVKYWTQFARFGFPSSFHAPFWPPYLGFFDDIQSLEPPSPKLEFNFAADHKCGFWDSVQP